MSEHTSPAALPANHSATPADRDYLPGMGRDWLLGIYDPITRLLGLGSAHEALVSQAAVPPGAQVLEIGCGTGNLALLLARRHPQARVVGLDPDPAALTRARRKAARAGLDVTLEQGFAEALPFGDATFERVLSAFMLHHLEPDGRREMLREVTRVLRPGGSLHLLDFGGAPHGSHGLMTRLARRSPRLRENFGDRIPELMRDAGLDDPVRTEQLHTRAGECALYRARAGDT